MPRYLKSYGYIMPEVSTETKLRAADWEFGVLRHVELAPSSRLLSIQWVQRAPCRGKTTAPKS
jgi:hypothetical protein